MLPVPSLAAGGALVGVTLVELVPWVRAISYIAEVLYWMRNMNSVVPAGKVTSVSTRVEDRMAVTNEEVHIRVGTPLTVA